MNKKEFVEAHCEKGTTENEHELYWWYFKLGREKRSGGVGFGFRRSSSMGFGKCHICEKEIVEGTVCWYDYELGSMHLECKEEMIE